MEDKRFKNRLFGRTRGRNKKINIQNYKKLIDKYKLTNMSSKKNYILDIGTGYGETSIYLSNKYKKKSIISCEKYIDGNLNLINNIENNKIENIYIHPGNVHEILDKIEKKNYFDLVWIFFPDPWPKKKHHKRRLINKNFLSKVYFYIKENGKILIVTDSNSYSRSILKSIYESKKMYHWLNQNSLYLSIKNYYDLETKFYKKAIFYGRKPSLFILKKI